MLGEYESETQASAVTLAWAIRLVSFMQLVGAITFVGAQGHRSQEKGEPLIALPHMNGML